MEVENRENMPVVNTPVAGLGEKLGEGVFKICYVYGANKVALVAKKGMEKGLQDEILLMCQLPDHINLAKWEMNPLFIDGRLASPPGLIIS